MKYIYISSNNFAIYDSKPKIGESKIINIVPFSTKEAISFGTYLFSEGDDDYIESLVEIKNRVYVRYTKMYGFNKE